jgi:hypothetical protein
MVIDSARNEQYTEKVHVYFASYVKIINTLYGQNHGILIPKQAEHEDLCRLVNGYRRFEG